jgi:hypothetical protein
MTSQPPSVQTTNSSHLGESTSGWREVVTPKPATRCHQTGKPVPCMKTWDDTGKIGMYIFFEFVLPSLSSLDIDTDSLLTYQLLRPIPPCCIWSTWSQQDLRGGTRYHGGQVGPCRSKDLRGGHVTSKVG